MNNNSPDNCNSLTQIRNKRVFIQTFGCTYNHGDTRKLTQVLSRQGCTIVQSPETADSVIINSCTVIEKTALKVLRTIVTFRNTDLYITGCMPEVEPGRILAISQAVFIPPHCIHEAWRQYSTVPKSDTGIIQIARGCNGHCSYCVTRFARGPLQSFPVEEILHQAEEYIRLGAVEIQLTAQDVSSWGMDKGLCLPDLLQEIICLDGDFRIRAGMMNPKTLRPLISRLLPVFGSEKMFQFIHVPAQSGSDTILERMNREYRAAEITGMIAVFKKNFPDISIMTDMIVGFPGESEEDFQASLSLIRKIRPNKVNITRFSRRPHTNSMILPDFTDYVKKKRSRNMNLVAEEVYHGINKPWLGKKVQVIVTEKIREGSVIARSRFYQGVVLNEDLPVGTRCQAVLTGERMYFFTGSRVIRPVGEEQTS